MSKLKNHKGKIMDEEEVAKRLAEHYAQLGVEIKIEKHDRMVVVFIYPSWSTYACNFDILIIEGWRILFAQDLDCEHNGWTAFTYICI